MTYFAGASATKKLYSIDTRALHYKSFYGRILRMFLISWRFTTLYVRNFRMLLIR